MTASLMGENDIYFSLRPEFNGLLTGSPNLIQEDVHLPIDPNNSVKKSVVKPHGTSSNEAKIALIYFHLIWTMTRKTLT
jgi:hypothetical protein